jgi:hypothetical protein
MPSSETILTETPHEANPPRWLSLLCQIHVAASAVALATILSTPMTLGSALLYFGLMILTVSGVLITLLCAWLVPDHWIYSNRTWVIALLCTIITGLVDKLTTPPLIDIRHWIVILCAAGVYLLFTRPGLRATLTPRGCLKSRVFNIGLALVLTLLIPMWGYSVLLVEPAMKDERLLKTIALAWMTTMILIPLTAIYVLVNFFNKTATTHILVKLWQSLSLVLVGLVMIPISVLLIAHLAPVG